MRQVLIRAIVTPAMCPPQPGNGSLSRSAESKNTSSRARSAASPSATLLEDSSRQLNGLVTEQRQHVTALLDAHLQTVTNCIANGRYDRATGLRLHKLAASLAQTVAWHRFDHGHHAAAGKLWIAGLHSAHATGDPDLGAAMLGDLAYQAAWRKDHTTAADLLRHALTRTEHPAARSLLHLRLARTLAAQGDKQPALRELKAAEHHLGATSGRPLPAWCAWMSQADLAVDSGQALLDLGDTRQAHRLISEGQALLPTSRDKTRGVFLTYQAASHLQLKEPERAAQAAGEALNLSRRIGAPRCEHLVRELLPAFEPYRTADGVPELLALAAA
ncbi:XRE family transcriptional regulator [Streptomyces sp. NPDC006430]|uniref:XRE family transcriptional regulator n=1 Tax=Streptomyces sp. NPDC006430 TaxID=3154299 RepID=UPI0033B8ACE1